MRVVLFGNDRPLTHRVRAFLEGQGVTLRFVTDRPPKDLGDWRPDLGVSVLYRHILKPDVLALFPRGVVNLHLGYLPWGRGAMPNVWAIVEGHPAGVTLHWVDEGIDTGPILGRREVPVRQCDTGESLYARLVDAACDLFVDCWRGVRDGTRPSVPQSRFGEGTHHRAADVEAIDRIDLEGIYLARTLLDRIRARTFPPYRGCYVEEDGRRVYLRLQLEEGEP